MCYALLPIWFVSLPASVTQGTRFSLLSLVTPLYAELVQARMKYLSDTYSLLNRKMPYRIRGMILQRKVCGIPGYAHSDGRSVLCRHIALLKAYTSMRRKPKSSFHEVVSLDLQCHFDTFLPSLILRRRILTIQCQFLSHIISNLCPEITSKPLKTCSFSW